MENKRPLCVLSFTKKRRQTQLYIGLCMVTLLCVGFVVGWWWQSIVALFCFYILNEVLWTDHLFYSSSSDYRYQLQPDEAYSVDLNAVSLPSSSACSTWLLPVQIKASVVGYWFDPYVIVSDGSEYEERQYFERGVNGLRYVNLSNCSRAINSGKELRLTFKYCFPPQSKAEVLGFEHPDYTQKRLLIIAPHADDAEIAAFGLYSEAEDVHIITLTAGEVEMENYAHIYPNPAEASQLKGRLRAMDGIAVPLWGGVPQKNCINLGYFCKQLSVMYQSPDESVESLTADLSDTRLFRQYNERFLSSDKNGLATWNNLIQDLVELIKDIQPEVILTVQPDIDPHPDHGYGTKALLQALDQASYEPEHILYYANHYREADMFPFGPEHTLASLPPQMKTVPDIKRVFSFPLTLDKQKDKIFALEMMHDLKSRQKLKKRIRAQLQRLVGRKPNRYGEEGYFRKAIKSNELFYCSDVCDKRE